MAFEYDLGVNLLAGFIGYGAALAKERLLDRRGHRNERTFWQASIGRRLSIVYPLYNGEFGPLFPRNMARIEDIAAGQMIIDTTESIGCVPVLANDEEAIDPKSDLALICSAKGNRRSREIEGTMKLPFIYETFTDKPSEIVNRSSKVRYISDAALSGERNDFALLARITDAANDRRIYCFWGIRGIGTLGAARFACHSPNLAEVNRAAGSRDFATVLRIAYEDPLKPKVVVAESQIITVKSEL